MQGGSLEHYSIDAGCDDVNAMCCVFVIFKAAFEVFLSSGSAYACLQRSLSK